MLVVRPQISETDIAAGMRLGARDVVSLSATERVQSVMSRELRSSYSSSGGARRDKRGWFTL